MDAKRKYDKPTVKIVNPLQVYKYMKQGVYPVEMFPDTATEKVVFVFYKSDTQALYKLWLNREI